MKAIEVQEYGDSSVLTVVERNLPNLHRERFVSMSRRPGSISRILCNGEESTEGDQARRTFRE
jgi:hypothetical protein